MPRAATEPRGTKVPDIRKGDEVLLLTGKDAGKRGTIDRLMRPDKVVVDGLNIAKRHTKPRARQGRNERTPRVQQGGIIEIAQPLHISNVMVICPACGEPTRVKHVRLSNGASVRSCARCGETLNREERS